MSSFFNVILAFFQSNRAWIPILIISIAIFVFLLLVKKSALKDILGLIANIIRTGLFAVLDFLNYTVEAIKSASNFIYAIRLLLFNKPHKDITTHVLQASIFFLSIASYIATFTSMSIVVNRTIALFLTFSIQATIVAIGINIGAKQEPFEAANANLRIIFKKTKNLFIEKNTDPDTDKRERSKYAFKKGLFKRILLVAVLTFCIMVSVGFSRIFLLNQINSSAYNAKTSLIEAQNSYKSILTDSRSGYYAFQATDLAVVAGWKQEIEDNKTLLLENANLLVKREGDTLPNGLDEAMIDDLIETLNKISFGNTDDESYTRALYSLDVDLLIYTKELLNSLDTQSKVVTSAQTVQEYKNADYYYDVMMTFNNLKILHNWLEQDGFDLNFNMYDLEEQIADSSTALTRANVARQVYISTMDEVLKTVVTYRTQIPNINYYTGIGRDHYSNNASSAVSQSAKLDELTAQLVESINQKEVSPVDFWDFRGPEGGLDHSNLLAWMLALGIDLIILFLCLAVGDSLSEKDDHTNAELVTQMATKEDASYPVDAKAIRFSSVYVLLVLVIIILNLCFPITWQVNLMMGFGVIIIILIWEVTTWLIESYKAERNKDKRTVDDASKVFSRLHKSLSDNLSQEIFDLMDGIKNTIGENALAWPVYRDYNSVAKEESQKSSMMIMFLQKQKLIKLEANLMYFSDEFIGYLLKMVLNPKESDDSLRMKLYRLQ